LVLVLRLILAKTVVKRKPSLDGRNTKASDTETSSSATGDGGTANSGGDLVSIAGPGRDTVNAQSLAGGPVNAIDLSGLGLASATDPDKGKIDLHGGSNSNGSGLPSLTPGHSVGSVDITDSGKGSNSDGGSSSGGSSGGMPSLAPGAVVEAKSGGSSLTPAQLEAAARAKIDEVLEGDKDPRPVLLLVDDIDENTKNAFTKAFMKSYRAWELADDNTAEKRLLDIISEAYTCRVLRARRLKSEYDRKDVRCDDHVDEANDLMNRVNNERWDNGVPPVDQQTLPLLYTVATEHIAQIGKDGSNPELIRYWEEFSAIRADADRQWQELCDAVDKDPTRPDDGQLRIR
jgi:hypothetical protein